MRKWPESVWMFHENLNSFSADISELEHAGMKDPWGDNIQTGDCYQHGGSEVTHWTIMRNGIELIIYND